MSLEVAEWRSLVLRAGIEELFNVQYRVHPHPLRADMCLCLYLHVYECVSLYINMVFHYQ